VHHTLTITLWTKFKFGHGMKVVMSVVNFIRSHGPNHSHFYCFLSDINAEYGGAYTI